MEKNEFVFELQLLGEQIGTGATADVYAYGQDKIAKIFHPGHKHQYTLYEFKVSKAIEETGLPVPHNFGTCIIEAPDSEFHGCSVIIQERMEGVSIMRLVMDYNEPKDLPLLSKVVEQVVELQARIHQVNAESLHLPEQKKHLHDLISMAPLLTEEEKEQLYKILQGLPAGKQLCHCDYHFDNIFSTEKGLVCFDWTDAVCGNPSADLARSILIFYCEDTPASIPAKVKEQIVKMREFSIEFYRETYKKYGSFDNLDAWLAIVAAGRLHAEVEGNRPAMLRVVRNYLEKVNTSESIG